MYLTSIIVFLSLAKCFQAHVSLLFPPARYPPLDFLDNARTSEPCGVPRPAQAQFTNLALGQTYDIVWHLGYAHKGGFQIDLLDSNGKVVKILTPNGFVGNESTNETTQMYTLTIPKDLQPCNQCVLRLQRNAQEWGSYKFWSCADVNVVQPSGSITPCFGALNGQTCQCPHLRSGQYCQFQDECADDSDCGTSQGKCIDLKTAGHPKKVCYCTSPYFGKHCDKKFEPKSDDSKQNCFNYKFNQPNLSVSPGTAGVDNLMTQYSNKGLFNPHCYHKETVEDNHFFYWRFVGDEVEMIMDYPGQSWIGVGWRPDYLNGRCQDFPVKTEDIQAHPELEPPHKVHKRESGHQINGTSSNATTPKPEPEPEPKPIAADHKPHAEPAPEPEGPATMHPMDCTDIVIASAQGKLTRAADMYTRDRSTPMDDSVYKGKDDLTAVYGAEVDGRTIIMFRRSIKTSDQSDHEITGDMHMIWARGQNPSEKQSVGHAEFYEPDVIKYHGGNRGSFVVSFVPSSANGTTALNNPLIHQTSTLQSSNVSNHNEISAGGHAVGTNAAQSGGNNNNNKNTNPNSKGNKLFSLHLFSTLIFFVFVVILM